MLKMIGIVAVCYLYVSPPFLPRFSLLLLSPSFLPRNDSMLLNANYATTGTRLATWTLLVGWCSAQTAHPGRV